jgi:hypothetical protein
VLVTTKRDVAIVLIDIVEDDDAKQDTAPLCPLLNRNVGSDGDRVGMATAVVKVRQTDRLPEVAIRLKRDAPSYDSLFERKREQE